MAMQMPRVRDEFDPWKTAKECKRHLLERCALQCTCGRIISRKRGHELCATCHKEKRWPNKDDRRRHAETRLFSIEIMLYDSYERFGEFLPSKPPRGERWSWEDLLKELE